MWPQCDSPIHPPSNEAHRCFITSIVVGKPEQNRLAGTITYQQDHGRSADDKAAITGSFSVADASKYRIGDVVNVTLS